MVGDSVTAHDNRGNGVGCDGGGSVELCASDISGNKQVDAALGVKACVAGGCRAWCNGA